VCPVGRGRVSPPLLCPGEAPSGILHLVLGSPVQVCSLQIEPLQKHLGEEKEKQERVEDKQEFTITWAPKTPDPVKIRKLIVSPEDWDGHTWQDLDQEFSEKRERDESEFKAVPITKAEVSAGRQGANCRDTIKTTPWDPLELANLQEKSGQKPAKSETEYLWHIFLTGGDPIKSDHGKAGSF